jgi:hypothetical protein
MTLGELLKAAEGMPFDTEVRIQWSEWNDIDDEYVDNDAPVGSVTYNADENSLTLVESENV